MSGDITRCFQRINGLEKETSVTTLETQIAGHGGILKKPDGRLLKPVQRPPKGQREKEFYISINKSQDPTDVRFRKFIPEFFGVEEIGFMNGVTVTQEFIVLDDVTDGFLKPNIMDVKIGRQTWGPDATEKKRKEEDSKYVGTKIPFGFSILSILVHSIRDDSKTTYDKSFGKHLKTEDVDSIPRIFFDVEKGGLIPELVGIVVERVRSILEMMENQRKYHLFASSLLIAYDVEAVHEFLTHRRRTETLEKGVNVKIIDFAHVFDSRGEKDENFVVGVRNFVSILEKLLQDFDNE